ncbi:MAG: hypothetical protein CL927_17740, partial [Deltaproteobacteria bacterium]|nr:hypothetical protein [Deltaproteobacteria bacterium]HCH63974.1 hypothetical protein [Deltaproteobacteria bacterium]
MVRYGWMICLLGGCAELHEGMQAGECLDGVDNDQNGIVDCADVGCMASPDCVPEGDSTQVGTGTDAAGSAQGSGGADDTGGASATDSSSGDSTQELDDEWVITEDVWDDSCNRNTVEISLPNGEVRVLDGWVWFRGDFGPEVIGIERGGRDTCQQVGNFGEYEGYNNRIVMYGIPDSESVVPVIPEA